MTRTASALRISGVNLQLLDGSGKTDSKTGKGNLILGYNETPGAQTGSHNVIVGDSHTATGYASRRSPATRTSPRATTSCSAASATSPPASTRPITGGYNNTASGTYGAVAGGGGNLAGAIAGSVSGGCGNVAGTGTSTKESTCSPEDRFQSVSGGTFNKARTSSASISGGCGNEVGTVQPVETQCEALLGTRFQWMGGGVANLIEANSIGTAAVGGMLNRVGTSGVEGDYAAAVGGNRNRATGTSSVALGGYDNAASYSLTTTTGGRGNDVVGYNGSSVGGLDNAVVGGYGASVGGRLNVAADGYSATVGGCANLAGDYTAPSPTDCPTTGAQVVVGGQENIAKGRTSVIAGGRFNEAVAGHNFGGAFGGCRNTVGSVKSATFVCEDYPSSFGGGRRRRGEQRRRDEPQRRDVRRVQQRDPQQHVSRRGSSATRRSSTARATRRLPHREVAWQDAGHDPRPPHDDRPARARRRRPPSPLPSRTPGRRRCPRPPAAPSTAKPVQGIPQAAAQPAHGAEPAQPKHPQRPVDDRRLRRAGTGRQEPPVAPSKLDAAWRCAARWTFDSLRPISSASARRWGLGPTVRVIDPKMLEDDLISRPSRCPTPPTRGPGSSTRTSRAAAISTSTARTGSGAPPRRDK